MMTDVALISPTDLRDYAKSSGWSLDANAARDRLFVLNHADFPRRQLVFPMDMAAPDYSEAVARVIGKLAEMHRHSADLVVKSILEVSDDAVAFRVMAPRVEDQFLPLSFASALLEGTKQLFLASACTVLRPQAHHPRLSRIEAQQFLDAARFRHTRPGSFVLNVSCPVRALDVPAPLFPGETDAPFVRRTTIAMQRGLQELTNAIETDTLDSFVSTQKTSDHPLVSSNFCEALTWMEDSALKNSVEISVVWAPSLPSSMGRGTAVKLQPGYFGRIDEVRRELRATERHIEDCFVGTVENLNGSMGADGKRSGEVILSLLLPEGDQVKARAQLSPDQYADADRAHMKEGYFVKVAGRLHPGRQPRALTDLRGFELIARF